MDLDVPDGILFIDGRRFLDDDVDALIWKVPAAGSARLAGQCAPDFGPQPRRLD